MFRKKIIAILGSVIAIGAGLSGMVYVKASHALSPGPLSAVSLDGETRGEYSSHADLENDCGHCHVPVHCIVEDTCTECHYEIAEQRQNLLGLHGRLPAGNCAVCHTEHKGRDADIALFAFQNVDHNALAGFSLALHETDHRGNPLDCNTCHFKDVYMEESLDCVTCHRDENPAYMALHMSEYGGRCLDCHDGQDRMGNFDHDIIYPLGEAHRNIECADCHFAETYLGTPRACGACHAEPEMHAGAFGVECEYCHESVAWTPAKLTQHTFRLDHGDGEQLACRECHDETYSGFTCFSCHEPQLMYESHAEYEIADIGSCDDCHPTGVSGEGEKAMDSGGLTDQSKNNPVIGNTVNGQSESGEENGGKDRTNGGNGGNGGRP